MQVQIGQADQLKGVVDLVSMTEIYFKGTYGEQM